MPILHLGVLEEPYSHKVPAEARRPRARVRKGGPVRTSTVAPSGGQTTGDVAEILEGKYHVMEAFFEENIDAIGEMLTESLVIALESLGSGQVKPPTAQAETKIEEMFKKFISEQKLDGVIPGVPTKASLKGINHRLAHPYAKSNPARPSFIDTGLYQSSFKAWFDKE